MISELVQNKSDSEILDTYQYLKSLGEHEAYFRLRTAFLENRYYNQTNTAWNGAVNYFVEEESKDVRNKKATIASLLKNNRFGVLTKINPFLTIKLMREGVIDSSLSDVLSAHRNQAMYLSNSQFKNRFSIVCFYLLLNEDYESKFRSILLHCSVNYPETRNLLTCIKSNSSIVDVERDVERLYRKKKDHWAIKKEEYDSLREQLLTLFVCNWVKGDMVSAQLFLMRAKRIISDEDYLYYVIDFLNKELFN